jgi:hypothetical protein
MVTTETMYEVLSPWAEADSVPYRAITPRIDGLANKKIGLFCNSKRVAEPILKVVENRLKKKFPSSDFRWFFNRVPNTVITDHDKNGEFETWLKGMDAVIAAYGD